MGRGWGIVGEFKWVQSVTDEGRLYHLCNIAYVVPCSSQWLHQHS